MQQKEITELKAQIYVFRATILDNLPCVNLSTDTALKEMLLKTLKQCLDYVKADAIGLAAERFRYDFEGARDADSIEAFFDGIADELRGNNEKDS